MIRRIVDTTSPVEVHWTCWQPTPYNDFLFEALSRDPLLNLTVHFRQLVVQSHPWKAGMHRGFCWRLFEPVLGVDWHLLRLSASRAFFVVAGWEEPTSIALLNVLMLRRCRFALWTDTPNLAARRSGLKQNVRSAWLKRVFKRADAVMGTGKPALAALRAMGCDESKLRNLPYSVDLDAFRPSKRSATSPPVVFVSSGRLHPAKGYDLALKALARVYGGKAGPTSFVYRIAGAGPEKERLRALSSELGISSSVQFLDWLEPLELPSLYESADILLHPARYEPYGVAVLEAMASGVAVIGSHCTGAIGDRVVDGVNGFVHATDDCEDLAQRIALAVSDLAKLDSVKRAARRTAEEWPVSRAVGTVTRLCADAFPAQAQLLTA